MEFVAGARPADMAEQLLALAPRIVGFGVYIWNVEDVTRTIAVLKQVAPEVIVVLGGPEVSHETGAQRICELADHVVTGWGDVSFPRLCREVLDGARPAQKVIVGDQPKLDTLELPYREYTDEDVAQRFIYVEASRGCPYKCEFCLSALDRTAWAFDPDRLLAELAVLHERGARHFRFVDRTFNLKISASLRLLDFFLQRLDDRLFLHFEVIPDHLPEPLREMIARFPPGTLHFEVGIQTWNPAVQALISRRQDNDAASANLAWLATCGALVHADLIAGLPGEDLESFGQGFNRLLVLGPHEIQPGILKRLRGAPISRHTAEHGMRYNPEPPYNVLATAVIGFADMQRITRFARYWELVANSGRLPRALGMLLGEAPGVSPFHRFLHFSDWLYAQTGKTHQFALERLCELVYRYLTGEAGGDAATTAAAIVADYEGSGARGRLGFMAAGTRPRTAAAPERARMRQTRHLPA